MILLIFGLLGCKPQSSVTTYKKDFSDGVKSAEIKTLAAKESIEIKLIKNEKTTGINTEYYIIPDSDKKNINSSDLFLFGDFTLRLVRNEIFARKGYIFKDKHLKEYFSNMPWYKENKNATGTFSDLNKIESANITAIDKFIKDKNKTLDNSLRKSTINGIKGSVKSVSKDLNYDGVKEEITAFFYEDTCEIRVKSKNAKEYSVKYVDMNINPSIKFADFDINDKLLQFYIESNGPSGDPRTMIYSFNGKGIVENLDMVGFITHYDGKSKIYSFDEYSVNCYFDLKKGLTTLPKENIVGKTVLYGNIQLFKKPGTDYTAVIISDFLTDPTYVYEGQFKSDYIGVIPKNTPLLVTDIKFLNNQFDENNLYYVPWLKVKTPGNIEGWFCLVYGD